MSLKHEIVQHYSLLDYKTFPEDITPPNPPRNLEGITGVTINGVRIKWDRPDGGGPVFYYELFKNNSHFANVSELSQTDPNPEDGDIYKARSVGVLGLKSGFSNTWEYEGSDSLNPYLNPGPSGMHIEWQDIRGETSLAIEGYNVYYGGSKINPTLIDPENQGYPKYNLTSDTEHEIGVSFEYDGGQESDIFYATGSKRGDTVKYSAILETSYKRIQMGGLSLLRSDAGISVVEGGRVEIYPRMNMRRHLLQDWPEWTTGGDFKRKQFRLGAAGSADITFYAGCGLSPGDQREFHKYDFWPLEYTVGEDLRDVLMEIEHDWNFKVTGPQCSGAFPFREFISAECFVNESDVREEILVDQDDISFIKWPGDDVLLMVEERETDVVVTWKWMPSMPYIKLFVKKDSDSSYPSDPIHNEELLVDADVHRYIIDNLEPGVNYNIYPEYYLMDGKTKMLPVNHNNNAWVLDQVEVDFTFPNPEA